MVTKKFLNVCIYVFVICNTSENLYTKEYINTVGNLEEKLGLLWLEEKLGLLWLGEKWGENVGGKPKNRKHLFTYKKHICDCIYLFMQN